MWWPSFDSGDNPQVWDPSSGTNIALPKAGANIFCAGHAFLPDGTLLVAGGHVTNWLGLPNAYRFNPFTHVWTRLPDMNDGRWYPTCTTLPSGNILVSSGWISSGEGVNLEPQVWQNGTSSWRNLSSAQLALPFYPFMFVAPNGKVFCAGPSQVTRYLDPSGTGSWSTVGNSNFGTRNWGSAVMYDEGKILLIGGSPCGPYTVSCTTLPTETAEIIDLGSSNPSWRFTGSMAGVRKLHNATLLPDGTVLITGGSRGDESPNEKSLDPAYQAELWNPATGNWSTMASLTTFRGYHSIALLLPDARVLSAGGQNNGGNTAEIYSPPYLFKGPRPKITDAPDKLKYGQPFSLTTPDSLSISQVTLIPIGSVTHGFNMSQRPSRAHFSTLPGGITVTIPSNNNITPPGYYMLFILNGSGVPSVAKIVQISDSADGSDPQASPTATPSPTPIPTPTPTPIPTATATPKPTPTPIPQAPTNLTATANSSNQITRSWTDNSSTETGFKIQRSTNGTTFTLLTTVGANVTNFADIGLTASTTYYYRVRSYNGTGNSGFSSISSTKTLPTPTPSPTPTDTPTPTPTPADSPTVTPTP